MPMPQETPDLQLNIVGTASCYGNAFHLLGLGTCQSWRENGWTQMLHNVTWELFQSATNLQLGQQFILQHDNNSKHKAKAKAEWWMFWKGLVKVPIFNFIENPWHYLKTAVPPMQSISIISAKKYGEESKQVQKYPKTIIEEAFSELCHILMCRGWIIMQTHFGFFFFR